MGKYTRHKPSEQDATRPLVNSKHEQLCVHTAQGAHWREVMERIGYQPHHSNYYQIRGRPEVKARLEFLKSQIAAGAIDAATKSEVVTREEVTTGLRDVVMKGLIPDNQGRRDLSSVVKAYGEMGRSIGMFSDRRILETEETIFDGMNPEEIGTLVTNLLGQLDANQLRQYVGNLPSQASDGAAPVSEGEPDPDVQAVSEASGVPSTRH